MDKIAPREVRYIKLGSGGKWVRTSFDRGEVHFGYSTVPHEPCIAGDWEAVAAILQKAGRNPGKAKDGVREIRDFYTLGAGCLWITFANRCLWWCFADPEVTWLGVAEDGRGARMRRTVSGWRNTTVTGEPLQMDDLSSWLTRVAAYRQTICRVHAEDYLIRRINGLEPRLILRAKDAKAEMVAVASEIIAQLHWADFETLVDLIFARSGWQRLSRVGGAQKEIDLIIQHPTIGERASVQVKSKATQAVLDDYVEGFRASGVYDRMFFVCHSPSGVLSAPEDEAIDVLAGTSLASMAINAGLLDWLTERVT